MKPVMNSVSKRFTHLSLMALLAGISGCADVGPTDRGEEQNLFTSDAPSGQDVSAPEAAVMQQALKAQQAAGATAVATTILAPLTGKGSGLFMGAKINQAVASLQDQFGDCVAVEREIKAATGNVTVEYTDCTGPFEALTFNGSSTADYALDLANGTTTLALVTDLTITVGADVVKAVSRMSTDIDVAGQSAVVDTSLEITGPDGQTEVHTGKLELAMAGTCVTATLGGNSATQQTLFEISDMTFCADGTACVQGVTLEGPERKLSLDFDVGGGGSFSFSGPEIGTQQADLPAGTELCVDVW